MKVFRRWIPQSRRIPSHVLNVLHRRADTVKLARRERRKLADAAFGALAHRLCSRVFEVWRHYLSVQTKTRNDFLAAKATVTAMAAEKSSMIWPLRAWRNLVLHELKMPQQIRLRKAFSSWGRVAAIVAAHREAVAAAAASNLSKTIQTTPSVSTRLPHPSNFHSVSGGTNVPREELKKRGDMVMAIAAEAAAAAIYQRFLKRVLRQWMTVCSDSAIRIRTSTIVVESRNSARVRVLLALWGAVCKHRRRSRRILLARTRKRRSLTLTAVTRRWRRYYQKCLQVIKNVLQLQRLRKAWSTGLVLRAWVQAVLRAKRSLQDQTLMKYIVRWKLCDYVRFCLSAASVKIRKRRVTSVVLLLWQHQLPKHEM